MIRLARDESGMSLIEVVVASAVMLSLLVIVTGFLISAQTTVVLQERRTVANDQARGAMEQLDREVRSSGFIFTLDQHALLVHTQSNAPTAGERCVHWVVQSGELLRREWPVGDPAQAGGWRTVAGNLVNQDLAVPTFVLPTVASNQVTTGGRTVDVTFLANANLVDEPNATVAIAQSLSGRNIAAGPPAAGVTWPPASPPAPCEVLP